MNNLLVYTVLFSLVPCTVSSGRVKRIISDNNAYTTALIPFIGSLHRDTIGHYCAASLISTDWLVTAAHCLPKLEDYAVFGYAPRLRERVQPPEKRPDPFYQIANFSSVIVHEGYDPRIGINDIALIRLTEPLTITEGVKPVAVSASKINYRLFRCFIAGWGADEANPCDSTPCQNGGECTYTGQIGEDTYECKCAEGYTGDSCEQTTGQSLGIACGSIQCLNGGICASAIEGSELCKCTPKYTGNDCSMTLAAVGPCLANPCQNGGTCKETDQGGFECTCADGFEGKVCNDEVTDNPCDSNPCNNEGTCTKTDDGFECTCVEGFEGPLYETEDPCRSYPCRFGGSCQRKADSFECTCREGFIGTLCEKAIYVDLQWSKVDLTNLERDPKYDGCKTKTDGFRRPFNPESMICVKDPQTDICLGDGGGPLFCVPLSSNIPMELAGVASRGGADCAKGNPSVFTRLSTYKAWIEEHTSITRPTTSPTKDSSATHVMPATFMLVLTSIIYIGLA